MLFSRRPACPYSLGTATRFHTLDSSSAIVGRTLNFTFAFFSAAVAIPQPLHSFVIARIRYETRVCVPLKSGDWKWLL